MQPVNAPEKTSHPEKWGNSNDREYVAFLQRLQERFTKNTWNQAIFTTSATDLWEVYLKSFPLETQQFHNCHACRHFIERFGGLVTIDEKGIITSAMWDIQDADELHAEAVARMHKLVSRARVTGVFLSSTEVLGTPMTPQSRKVSGPWIHLTVSLPKGHVLKSKIQTAGQKIAEKAEDWKNVMRALDEFSAQTLSQALTLLNTDSLYRSEKVRGPAQWLSDLQSAVVNANRANVVWRAIATAPTGFCHPRASMIGTLLDDIASGMEFETVRKRFEAKMHPLGYQRPQSAPSNAQIEQANQIIEKLSAEGSLVRRYATLEEIQAIWKPTHKEEVKGTGVFDHLRKKESVPQMKIPAQVMTWEKFVRTILPTAQKMECLVPDLANFVAYLTATNSEAPPILQWDSDDVRNPASWYMYHGGSRASAWGLAGGTWVPVAAISGHPSHWFDRPSPQNPLSAVLILEGARDTNGAGCGLALFPESLKSEFHGIRATIEAFSRSGQISGLEHSTANGILIATKGKERIQRAPLIRVSAQDGTVLDYQVDRWD